MLTRETEYELVDVCRNEGVGILPWSPLKGYDLIYTGQHRGQCRHYMGYWEKLM